MASFVRRKSAKDKKEDFDDASDVQNIFQRYDSEGSGDIDRRELLRALNDWGVKCTPKQLDKLMVRFATGGDAIDGLGVAQFGELMKALHAARRDRGVAAAPVDSLPHQNVVRRLYAHPLVSWVFAFFIMANFCSNIIEKEIDPGSDVYPNTWRALDTAFTIIFLVELLINMYGCGGPHCKEFYGSAWNVFDTIIVTIGVVLMTGANDGPLSSLKLLRAFRILRLGKRVKSLNKMMEALMSSIPGLISALALMLIFFCIYAIVAVELFRDFGQDGTYTTYNQNGGHTDVSSITPRGLFYGHEYYGSFARSMYTLFQVMTGESWSEAVARPLVFGYNQGNATVVSLFFVSFILLLQTVMINVFVAVLLDKFVGATDDEPLAIDASDLLRVSEDIYDRKRDDTDLSVKAGNRFHCERLIAPARCSHGSSTSSSGSGPLDVHAKLDMLLQRDEMLLQQMAKLQDQVNALAQKQNGNGHSESPNAFVNLFMNRGGGSESNQLSA